MYNDDRNYKHKTLAVGFVIGSIILALCAIVAFAGPSSQQQGYYDGGYSVPVYVPVLGGSHYGGGSYHATHTTVNTTTTIRRTTNNTARQNSTYKVRPATIRTNNVRPSSQPSYNVRPSSIRISRGHM